MPKPLEIALDRFSRVFKTGDTVTGVAVVDGGNSGLQHNGITLVAEGTLSLQLSTKSLGIFEAFYASIKPLILFDITLSLSPPGKLPPGATEIPFSFPLKPSRGNSELCETYQGVFISISYDISVTVARGGVVAKALTDTVPFHVVAPGQAIRLEDAPKKDVPVVFKIEPGTIKYKKSTTVEVPTFLIEGQLNTVICDIDVPLSGFITVKESSQRLKSIEIQLVRVEYCAGPEGIAKEATEIQNIQIGDGDVALDMPIPIYMFFPRWFTCPSVMAGNYRVEFEVNMVVVFADHSQITENIPIRLFRSRDAKVV